MPADSAKVFVHLLDSDSEVVFHGYTDENGMVTVEKILEGNYGYIIEFKGLTGVFKKNGYFQIVAGDDKKFMVNLSK